MEYLHCIVGGAPSSRGLVGNQAGISNATCVYIESIQVFPSQGLSCDLGLSIYRGRVERGVLASVLR